MNWIPLTSFDELAALKEASKTNPQVIFKHSTRCSVSSMALNRFERAKSPEGISFHFIDLLKYRDISDSIAETFSVYHESPQVLLIINNECVYDESHMAISIDDIIEQASAA